MLVLFESAAQAGIDDIVIKGKVFYNDNRFYGHFERRKDIRGNKGAESVNKEKTPNWLGAYKWTVDIIELDKDEPNGSKGCKKEQTITTVGVKSDGSFKATIKGKDGCKYNVAQILDVQVRAKMKYCFDEWCISFRDAEGDIYAQDIVGATYEKPLKAKAGKTYNLVDHYYPVKTSTNTATIKGVASNYYASAVDGAVFLHDEKKIPFYKEEYGELYYHYPSSESGTATALSPQKIAISSYNFTDVPVEGAPTSSKAPAWIWGRTSVHEYGHILMQRAWGGGYGYPGVGRTANDWTIAKSPSPQIAFKEAWAEFILKAVFADETGCSDPKFDINNAKTFDLLSDQNEKQKLLLLGDEERSSLYKKYADSDKKPNIYGPILAPISNGKSYRYNNLKFLCDFADNTPEQLIKRSSKNKKGNGKLLKGESKLASPGIVTPLAGDEAMQYPSNSQKPDSIRTSVQGMWDIMRMMYVKHLQYDGKYHNPGLNVCDWADYYVNIKNSATTVGKKSHQNIARDVDNILSLNNLDCERW